MASATTRLSVERVIDDANEVGEMEPALAVPFVRSRVNPADRLLRFTG
jgi:hypothetical protein